LKYYRFWADTETTGIKPEFSQILEYGIIVEDSLGQFVEKLEVKLLLRPFINPSKEALAINNIDPYSSEWKAGAISEEQAAEKLAALCEKYTVEGLKPVMCAYNADFDADHIKQMFFRHGIIFEACFCSALIDPLKTAKWMVKNGMIKTRMITKEVKGRKPSSYASSKLVDVAEALGVSTGKEAHRALNDVETMILATRAMYKQIFAKDMVNQTFNLNKVAFEKTYNLIMESNLDGLKARPVKILRNDFDQKQLTVVDLLDYEKIGLSPSNVKTFNYNVIFDETEIDSESLSKLEYIYDSNKSFYMERVK
jgi:DNA polymerase III epsilon subunit-like protein